MASAVIVSAFEEGEVALSLGVVVPVVVVDVAWMAAEEELLMLLAVDPDKGWVRRFGVRLRSTSDRLHHRYNAYHLLKGCKVQELDNLEKTTPN